MSGHCTLDSVHVRHVRDPFASNPPHSSSPSMELKRATGYVYGLGNVDLASDNDVHFRPPGKLVSLVPLRK